MLRLLAASFALAACAQAATIRVPGDQPTIQRGINAATAGDTVLVAAGTYHESFDFIGKDLVIKGQGGAANTVVSGDSLSPVVTMNDGETEAAVLEGFTIREGAGGIYLQDASPTITACRIFANSANNGGGVYCDSNSSPNLLACKIQNNSARTYGGGLYSDSNTGFPTLVACVVANNYAGYKGGGLYCRSAEISKCVIEGNSTDDEGGGLYLYAWGAMSSLWNCTIDENQAQFGGGLYCTGDSVGVFNNTISNNSAYSGGGIYLRDGSPTLMNNTITANTGNGMYIANASPALTNCIFWADNPTEIALSSGSPTVTYCDVQGDYPGEGNFGLDPRFVPYRGFDYLLHPLSPCIDAGDPTIEDRISDWHPRWPNFYMDGPRSDMGAYGGPGNVGWLP